MAAPSSMPCRVGATLTRATALITDDAALAAYVATLGDTVGVDTEFMRVRTFHPIPALYQLAGNGDAALVDAQAPADFASLKTLLAEPAYTKVMHSISEDLEVIAHHFHLRPTNVVDTQIAHAFLTEELSASYATVVKHYEGIELEKHETRSDWLQRPLTEQQLAYAREDVAYLRPIWKQQREALAANGRLAWFLDEMRDILEAPLPTPETWYRNVKGSWRLSDPQLAALRGLVSWREEEARRRDVPRAWTVPDDALLQMARQDRLSSAAIGQLLPPRAARRYAQALLRAHRDGAENATALPRPPKPLGRAGNEVAKSLRHVVEAMAQRLGLAAPILARRRDLEDVIRHFRAHGELPAKFQGWRDELLGDAFRSVLTAAQ